MFSATRARTTAFQLTRSRGAWRWKHCTHKSWRYFNSHAHVERDHPWQGGWIPAVISTHTLTWSVTGKLPLNVVNDEFQLTRSRGAWRFSLWLWKISIKFQLTRSRGAWRRLRRPESVSDYFNSHAHVERDCPDYLCFQHIHISTHTLTWSVTLVMVVAMATRCHFNSHAHVERDARRLVARTKHSGISTHTLTWSVTSSGVALYNLSKISTHTLTWSVTTFINDVSSFKSISTHTLTWSVTLDVVYIWCLLNMMRTYFFI